jgi:penicillin-binding protein 2
VIIGSFVLLANLFYLQILKREYRTAARDRTLIMQAIQAPRGIIYDREDRFLVVNQPSYELEMVYNEVDPEMDLSSFCELLGITEEMYHFLVEEARSKSYYRRYLPIRFLSNIDPEQFAVFQEHLYRFPGFYPIIKSKRQYPYPHAAHVLGYISEASLEDINQNENNLEIGDYKGASGVENTYDPMLRGRKGFKYILKDNVGREVEPFQDGALDSAAIEGNSLITTLDIELQRYAENLMVNKKGSIVAIEPTSGEIITLLSSPGYDPNLLSIGQRRNETFLSLLTDTLNRPLLNRALQAKYPPGSIFKTILSLVALQEGVTRPNRSIRCTGEYVINRSRGFVQGCRDHPRPRDIQTALQFSCNTYFFQVIREFLDQFGANNPSEGLSLLNKHLYDFGLGSPLGIDLANENGGFVPTPAFYDDLYNTPEYSWRSTYILSLGIGQGELEFTTLQMANLAAIIANRGHYYTPHIAKSFNGQSDLLHQEFAQKRTVSIDSSHFVPVIDGMEKVISSGTARRAYVPGIDICGKTGTSQNPHGEDHSVFFAFAPKENPKIAIAVYVENAGGGSAYAAPIGGLVIEKYLNGEIQRGRQYLEDYVLSINLINPELP